MLNSVFKEAIQNREKTLSILKGPKYEKIIQKAKENWVEYKPQKEEIISAGIDSSFNSTKSVSYTHLTLPTICSV